MASSEPVPDHRSVRVERLWSMNDLAAYLGCSDPTAATKAPGFPTPLRLHGVRGPRWHGPSIDEYFRRLSLVPGEPISDTQTPTIPVMPIPTLDELRGAS
jgi:hypothetical protein